VDVSSGVESTRGVKDHAAIHRFVRAAREAAAEGADGDS
jgi:phosphoribosylanthranilate isomerase